VKSVTPWAPRLKACAISAKQAVVSQREGNEAKKAYRSGFARTRDAQYSLHSRARVAARMASFSMHGPGAVTERMAVRMPSSSLNSASSAGVQGGIYQPEGSPPARLSAASPVRIWKATLKARAVIP
jgi:hypothetical protein